MTNAYFKLRSDARFLDPETLAKHLRPGAVLRLSAGLGFAGARIHVRGEVDGHPVIRRHVGGAWSYEVANRAFLEAEAAAGRLILVAYAPRA